MTAQNPSPRQRRRQDLVQSIIDAAMTLLAELGLEGLTMRRLARELGYTEPALYRYFASKDALLAALTSEVISRLAGLLERALPMAEEQESDAQVALVKVALIAEVYALMMRRWPGEAALLTLVLGDPRYLVERDASAVTVDAVDALLRDVESVLRGAAEAGVIEAGDAMTRGVLLWTSAHGAAQLRKFDRFGVAALEVSKVTRAFVENLLLAWGAAPSEISAALEGALHIANQVVLSPASQKE